MRWPSLIDAQGGALYKEAADSQTSSSLGATEQSSLLCLAASSYNSLFGKSQTNQMASLRLLAIVKY